MKQIARVKILFPVGQQEVRQDGFQLNEGSYDFMREQEGALP
jgi:hypothetical protein